MDNIRNNINFEEFQYNLIQQINEKGIETDVYHSYKINRDVTAITNKNGDAIKPTLYIEDMYMDYMYGKDMVDIVNGAVEALSPREQPDFKMPTFTEPDAKNNLYCAVINRDMNTELLKKIPHQNMEDLALVVRYNIDDKASCFVNDYVCSSMQLTSDEIFKIAKENTFNSEYRFNSLYETVSGLLGSRDVGLEDFTFDKSIIPDNDAYVLTNKEGVHGAALIFSKQILNEVHDKINDNFYILPSSIHDVIIMPSRFVDEENFAFMKDIVKEINQTVVDDKDKLSDNVYYYNARTNTFSIADGNERKMADVEKLVKVNVKGR